MKKKLGRKLQLSRETLHSLESTLTEVAGGATLRCSSPCPCDTSDFTIDKTECC